MDVLWIYVPFYVPFYGYLIVISMVIYGHLAIHKWTSMAM